MGCHTNRAEIISPGVSSYSKGVQQKLGGDYNTNKGKIIEIVSPGGSSYSAVMPYKQG